MEETKQEKDTALLLWRGGFITIGVMLAVIGINLIFQTWLELVPGWSWVVGVVIIIVTCVLAFRPFYRAL